MNAVIISVVHFGFEILVDTKEHPNNIRNLYKYINGNYHKDSKLEWDVHCPVCSKSYRGDLH